MEYLAEVEGQLCYIFLDFARRIFVKAACNSDANLISLLTLLQMLNIQLLRILNMDFFIRLSNWIVIVFFFSVYNGQIDGD